MKTPSDLLLLNKDRRSRSWQDWSKKGRKKLFDRFLGDKTTTTTNRRTANDTRLNTSRADSKVDRAARHGGVADAIPLERSSSDYERDDEEEDDEELDLIISSWKQNFYYFQEEQARRAAAKSKLGSSTMGILDADEEDSILMAILEEEEESFDEEESEEEDYDEDTVFDDRTIFSLATHEESEFREFVRCQDQKRQLRPFMDRFMEVLGMTDEEDDGFADIASIGDATFKSMMSSRSTGSRTTYDDESVKEFCYNRGGEGERDVEAVEYDSHTSRIQQARKDKVSKVLEDDDVAGSILVKKTQKRATTGQAKGTSRVHFGLSRTMTM